MAPEPEERQVKAAEQIASEGKWRNMALNRIANNLQGSLINKGLLLAMCLVAMDCLLVAHYQPEVALTLLRWTPPVALLEGALINLMPVVVPVIVGVAVVRAAMQLAGVGDGNARSATALSSLMTAGALYVLSQLLLPEGLLRMGWMLAGVIVAILGLLSSEGRPRLATGLGVLAVSMALVGALTTVANAWGSDAHVLQTQLARPWAPAEILTWKEGNAPTVGYVLTLSDGWVTILEEGSRKVVMRPASDLVGREVCNVGSPVVPRVLIVPRQDSLQCPS